MNSKADSKMFKLTGTKGLAFLALAAGCGLFFAGHYLLGEWAETSLFAHDIQHFIIFAAGIFAGGASLKLLGRK